MNFSLGKKLEDYVARQIAEGPYNNASEVVRDALRMHEEHSLKLESLRREIHKGLTSLEAGRLGTAQPADIMARAKTRKRTS
ncbi:type II toxin-antitoxin system ParD family antitoxin [Breoghania sp. JC706]|uniref:type II toxin-antitoxin system ParD family antitoxin n=1 Tax=Breoghania sp. JC706 TaxID=3117732 RepID=UPI00300B2540